jgi:hypothetical protein
VPQILYMHLVMACRIGAVALACGKVMVESV